MQKQLETTNIKNNPTWSSPLHLCRSLSEDGLKNRKNQIKILQMERMSLLTVLRLLHEDKGAEDSEKKQAHTPPPSQDHVKQTQNGDNWRTVESKKEEKSYSFWVRKPRKRDMQDQINKLLFWVTLWPKISRDTRCPNQRLQWANSWMKWHKIGV